MSEGYTLLGQAVGTGAGTVAAGDDPRFAGPNMWTPADHGFTSWAFDPSFLNGAQLTVNGTLYITALRIRVATTITNVYWHNSTAGVTPTSGQNFAALISSAGAVLSSVGVDAKVTSANALQTAVLGTPQAVASGFVWVALLFNAATPPTVFRANPSLNTASNVNLAATAFRYATAGTSLTALPGSITPASNVVGPAIWAAVS